MKKSIKISNILETFTWQSIEYIRYLLYKIKNKEIDMTEQEARERALAFIATENRKDEEDKKKGRNAWKRNYTPRYDYREKLKMGGRK